ncbi:hypothetical protein K2173_003146 [Erythroxylum novogranatense]|uniref:Nodulin-like domain-containing protein n=1 Tax=Erythroxylum novogranatense TaxID=1862640 RepID=A0AAV8TBK0_9ROSI|nr:hypothetical protein K2173_003146 [Erythroxylum novogranatense]
MSSSTFQWLNLVGIIWLQSVSGTNSDFPAYSSQFKQLLSLSQLQLNFLAFASDAGKLFAFIPGFAVRYLPLWMVLLIGAALSLIGYGVQYLFLTGHGVSSLSYTQMFLLTVIAGNSLCWINTVCNIATARNFVSNHQIAVGLTTSYQVLSAEIYTVLVDAIVLYYPAKIAEIYLLLNSILPMIISLMAVPILKDFIAENGKSMRVKFLALFVLTIATGMYAVDSSLRSKSGGLSPVVNAVVILLFLIAPLVIPLVEKIIAMVLRKWRSNGEKGVGNINTVETVERMENGLVVKDQKNDNELEDHDSSMEDIGVRSIIRRLNFWLYFFVYLFGATLGLVYLNNLGQIAESRGCTAASLLSLSSSFGFFGRLISSFIDYFLSRSKRSFSRPVCISAFMVPMALAFLMLLNGTDTFLFMSTAIIGVCTGAITSMSVCLTLEMFGSKKFGMNHNTVVANIPIGSFVFGFLAALFYHKEEHSQNSEGKCMGMECYKTTFIIWGSLCCLGTFLSFILHLRTRTFYSQKYGKR